MANPQTENGYVKIANEIIDQLTRYRLSGEEYQVLLVIIRKTWGFNKIKDQIALSQFSYFTGLKRPTVVRALNKLLKRAVIKKDNTYIKTYSFNKDFDTWRAVIKKDTGVSKKITGVIKNDNKTVIKKDTYKRQYKDNYTKDNTASSGLAREIVEIINIFKGINPLINFGNKTTRSASEELIKKFGLEDVKRLATYAVSIQGRPYSPTITTPHQLKEKLGQLKVYSDKNKQPKIKSL